MEVNKEVISFLLLFHLYFNNSFHEFKVLKKVMSEMFNINFHDKFI